MNRQLFHLEQLPTPIGAVRNERSIHDINISNHGTKDNRKLSHENSKQKGLPGSHGYKNIEKNHKIFRLANRIARNGIRYEETHGYQLQQRHQI